jgi:hypothetical protein
MTLDGGKCRKLTPPPTDLLTNPKPRKHRIRVLIMGVSFLAHDLADDVRQTGLAAWGSVRHSRASLPHDSE